MTVDLFTVPGQSPPPAETTEHHGYPLPPALREFRPAYDHYNRYVLPDPEGVRDAQPYTRVTTGGKTLDDTDKLERWKLRSVVQGIKTHPHLLDDIDLYQDPDEVRRDLEDVAERAHVLAGGVQASEWGTCIHAWLEALEGGKVTWEQVPDEVKPFCEAYGIRLQEWGIRTVPGLIERIVHNPWTGWVGTFDRIYELADGSWVIGDVKTAKDLRWSYLAIAIQLDDYAEARSMLSLDGTRWEPMPQVRQDFAVVAWVPSNADPVRCELVTIDLEAGHQAIEAALEVRDMRRNAGKVIPHRHQLPKPGPRTLHALTELVRTARSREDLAQMYEAYADYWTPELTALGNRMIGKGES